MAVGVAVCLAVDLEVGDELLLVLLVWCEAVVDAAGPMWNVGSTTGAGRSVDLLGGEDPLPKRQPSNPPGIT